MRIPSSSRLSRGKIAWAKGVPNRSADYADYTVVETPWRGASAPCFWNHDWRGVGKLSMLDIRHLTLDRFYKESLFGNEAKKLLKIKDRSRNEAKRTQKTPLLPVYLIENSAHKRSPRDRESGHLQQNPRVMDCAVTLCPDGQKAVRNSIRRLRRARAAGGRSQAAGRESNDRIMEWGIGDHNQPLTRPASRSTLSPRERAEIQFRS